MGVCGGSSPLETAVSAEQSTGKLDRRTLVLEMHVAFKMLCKYDYITESCRTQVEEILNHVNPIIRGIGQEKVTHGKYTGVKLGADQAYDCSAYYLSFGVVKLVMA